MLRHLAFVFSILFGVASVSPENLRADSEPCSDYRYSQHFEDRTGSSSIISNMFGSDDSIKAQLRSMLEAAGLALKQMKPPTDLCPVHCQARPSPQLEFAATPRKFLSRYSDQPRCDQHFEKTSILPIVFKGEVFSSFQDLSKSFSSVARGSGEMGEKLYEQCDGSCSPRYRIYVTPQPGGLFLSHLEVVCGPARDKSTSEYRLSTAITWGCEDPSN